MVTFLEAFAAKLDEYAMLARVESEDLIGLI